MNSNPGVTQDLVNFRAELAAQGLQYKPLLALRFGQVFIDAAIDWMLILASVALVVHGSSWFAPLAVLVIANRQRAIGNSLHDAGHSSLHRDRRINDAIAYALIAPAAFSDVQHYRRMHLQHHMNLGLPADDPDYLPPMPGARNAWLRHLAHHVFSLRQWWGSIAGHLGMREVPALGKLYIAGWWLLAGLAIVTVAGEAFATVFALLWMTARATAFHVITLFREMCDHYGLRPGGILSFSRDVSRQALLFRLIHPRNNGYHLTHHLLPAVPYYRLPDAQALFARTEAYRANGKLCRAYFGGPASVVASWGAAGGSSA